MIMTYHLYEKSYRDYMDWTEYQGNLEYAIESFPMIKLLQVTPDDFTICVNTKKDNVKNKVVRAFGQTLANFPVFSEFVVFKYGSHRLIVEKK